jgi:hypothetical protein
LSFLSLSPASGSSRDLFWTRQQNLENCIKTLMPGLHTFVHCQQFSNNNVGLTATLLNSILNSRDG